MSARDFLINVGVIVTVMAIAALIETVLPMFIGTTSGQRRRAANLWLTATSIFSNWLLASVAAIGVRDKSSRGATALGISRVSATSTKINGSSTSCG